MQLTHTDIAEIIKLMDSSTLDELVLEVGGVRIEARRNGAHAAPERAPSPPATAPVSDRATPRHSVAAGPPPALAQPPVEAPELRPDQIAVRAPMVGTFYRRPSPDAPPFVEIGTHVEAGDTLCLVEVMKLYTTITAETSGTVTRIAAEDATLVEYDQLMFVIDPD